MLTSFNPLYWGGTATGRPSWRGTDEPGKEEMKQRPQEGGWRGENKSKYVKRYNKHSIKNEI